MNSRSNALNLLKKFMLLVLLLTKHLVFGFTTNSHSSNSISTHETDKYMELVESDDFMKQIGTLKRMLNNFTNTDITGEVEQGKFIKPHNKQDDLLNKILDIQKSIKNLNNSVGDIANLKSRIATLELELEDFIKEFDGEQREKERLKDQIEGMLQNITSSYNDMQERLLLLEEPKRLKDLDEELRKGDYGAALKNEIYLRNDTKVEEIVKQVYNISKDFNGFLYFCGMTNNLGRRVKLLQTLWHEELHFIFSKYPIMHINDLLKRKQFLALVVCNSLKLSYALENNALNDMSSLSADYNNTSKAINEVKKSLVIFGKFLKPYELLDSAYISPQDKFKLEVAVTDRQVVITDSNKANKNISFTMKYELENSQLAKLGCSLSISYRLIDSKITLS